MVEKAFFGDIVTLMPCLVCALKFRQEDREMYEF